MSRGGYAATLTATDAYGASEAMTPGLKVIEGSGHGETAVAVAFLAVGRASATIGHSPRAQAPGSRRALALAWRADERTDKVGRKRLKGG